MKHRRDTTHAVPGLLRKLNERRVLEMLLRHGHLSRADLSRLTHISAPTISKTVASLTKRGLIEEEDAHGNKTGRPGKLFSLATHASQIAGLALGPDHCHVICSGVDCSVTEDRQLHFDTPDSYDELVRLIVHHVKDLLSRHPGKPLGLGVSVPALADPQADSIVRTPAMPLIDGRPLGEDLSHKLKMKVVVMKQAHALCLSQRLSDGENGDEDFTLIDTSDPLAMGAVIGGKLFRGSEGHAGALGRLHMNQAAAVAAVIDLFNPSAVYLYDPQDGGAANSNPRLADSVRELAQPESLTRCRIQRAAATLAQAPLACFLYHVIDSLGPFFQ